MEAQLAGRSRARSTRSPRASSTSTRPSSCARCSSTGSGCRAGRRRPRRARPPPRRTCSRSWPSSTSCRGRSSSTARSRSSSPPTSTRCPSSSTPRPAASTPPSTRRWRPPAGSPPPTPTSRTSRSAPPEGRRIREAFVAEPGHLLLSADYSQIELRVLAHLSGGPDAHRHLPAGRGRARPHVARDLRPALRGPAGRAAADLQDGQLRAALREDAPSRLAKDIGVSRKEAERFIEAYFARYPTVRAFIDETIAKARETGHVRTLLGRLRRLPDLRAKNFPVRMEAERQAMNTPVQGSAADLIKQAMIDLHRELARAAACARGSSCRSTTSCCSRCRRPRPRQARALVKRGDGGRPEARRAARRRRPPRPELGRGALTRRAALTASAARVLQMDVSEVR